MTIPCQALTSPTVNNGLSNTVLAPPVVSLVKMLLLYVKFYIKPI